MVLKGSEQVDMGGTQRRELREVEISGKWVIWYDYILIKIKISKF